MRQLLPPVGADPAEDVDTVAAYALPAPGARHVRVNFVATPEGVVTLDGASAPLSSPADQKLFATMRSLSDVILVGAGTMRHEGYRGVRPSELRTAIREQHGLPAVPPIAVISRSLAFDFTTPFFTEPLVRPVLYTTGLASPEVVATAEQFADVVVAGEQVVDMTTVVADLVGRGLAHILCEGGPQIFGELLAADLVDELCLTLAPVLAGAGEHRLTGDLPLAEPRRMRLAHLLEADDGYLFCRYVRR